MTKIYCDICEKEIRWYKSDFSFVFSPKWNEEIKMEHICDDCNDKLNAFILDLKTTKTGECENG